MQDHEHTTYEDDADTFNFLQVAFDQIIPEDDEQFPLLATPVAHRPEHDSTQIESPGFNTYEFRGVVETPSAPVIKDLDSFTEGTGAGSFADLVDEDGANELVLGPLVAHPEPSNPNALIMAWLEDVPITVSFSDPIAESNAPRVSHTELPEDSWQMEALERTGALLREFSIDGDEEDFEEMDSDDGGDHDVNVNVTLSVGGSVRSRIPSPSNLVSSMSTPLVPMTPRAMKRARSRSPASQTSRHVRSKSLSSIHGLPRDLPPWRTNHFVKD